jgi:alpha-mannosidase
MSLVEVTPENVVLSSMRLVPAAKPGDRPLLELRLYETAGRPADVSIRLPRPAISAQPTNFLGEPPAHAATVRISGNEIQFHLEPWKIVTLRVKDQKGPAEE